MKKLLCLACLVLAATALAQQVYVNGVPQTFSLWGLSIPQPTVNGTVLTYTTGPAALSWAAAGGLTGSGTAGQLSLWSGASALTTDAGAIYDIAHGNYKLGQGAWTNLVYNAAPGDGNAGYSGYHLTCVGDYCMSGAQYFYDSTCVGNSCMGQGANMGSAGGGTWNDCLGNDCMTKLTSGALNSCLGEACMAALTTGSQNVSVGSDTLSVSTGSYNTSVGSATLTGTYNGSQSTALGYNAGRYQIGNSGIYLGALAGKYSGVPWGGSTERMLHIESFAPEWPFILGSLYYNTLALRGDTTIVNGSDGAGGARLGAETVSPTVNWPTGHWDANTGAWVLSGNTTATFTNTGNTDSLLTVDTLLIPAIPNTWYQFSYNVTVSTPASNSGQSNNGNAHCQLFIRGSYMASASTALPLEVGSYTVPFYASATQQVFGLEGFGDATACSFAITGMSVKQLLGGTLTVNRSITSPSQVVVDGQGFGALANNGTASAANLTLSTVAVTTASAAGTLPANSEVRFLTYRITTTFTGCTSFNIRPTSAANPYVTIGTATSAQTTLTAGTTGVLVPPSGLRNYTSTANTVTITCNSNATAGAIRLTPFYTTVAGPTS